MLSLVDNISTRESREGAQIFYFKKRFNTCFSLDKSASLEHPMRRLFYNFDNEPKRQRNISACRGDSEVVGMSSVFRVRTFVGVFITLLLAVHLSSVSAVADESSVAEDASSTPLQSIASSQEGAQNETTDTAQGKSHGASTAPEGTAQPSESAGRGSSSTPNAIPNNSSSADSTGRESDSSAEQQQPVNPAQNANSGWVSKDGKKYYYDPTTHALRKGWLQLGNSRYYLDPNSGEMRTGVVRVGGEGYLLAPSGAMRTGWAEEGGAWYLASTSGALRTGWAKDGAWYYLDPQTFEMRTGWVKDGGAWYYLGPSGALRTGWVKDGGAWYYLDPSGAMLTGWVKTGGAWYYLDPSGAMLTGTNTIGGIRYTFNSGGSLLEEQTADYTIMGNSNTSVNEMVRLYNSSGASYPSNVYNSKGAASIEDFCQIVFEEARSEGVNAEVAFCQEMNETNWLRFGGDVQAAQCNFAGLGATGNGAPGNTFPDVRTGVRAQVQHLKAYASTAPLKNNCVDTRFDYVRRGSAPTVSKLSGTWAASKSYGQDLLKLIDELQSI